MGLFELQKVTRFYFDRFVINTELSEDALRGMLPLEELEKHCTRLWIGETSNTSEYWSYATKIDASDATDNFVKILSRYDLGHCGISYIEVTMDIEFETFKDAKSYQFHLERTMYKKWERNRFTIPGPENDTNYIGKKYGVINNNYIEMYSKEKDENPFGEQPFFHFEFKLSNWNKIQKSLKLSHYSELREVKEIFQSFQKRYLSEKEINKKLLIKKLIQLGVEPAKARERVESLLDIRHLRERIAYRQDQITRRKHFKKLRKKLNLKRIILTKMDKFYMGFKINSFLKDKIVLGEDALI